MNLIGNLLIAPPAVRGNFWYKTVIMITEDHDAGSVGLVLNKRTDVSINEFGSRLGFSIDLPGFVYQGGPINTKSLTLLHSTEWSCKNTLQISDDFSISSADDILPRFALGDTPREWRMFMGMCGWAPEQLQGELLGIPPWDISTSWCTVSATHSLVFDNDNKDQWCQALDRSAQEFAENLLT